LDIQEGLEAYTAKQAQILEDLAQKFADEWYGLLTVKGLNTDWPVDLKGVRKGSGSRGSEGADKEVGDHGLDDDDDFFD
jgi:hypothetical protein